VTGGLIALAATLLAATVAGLVLRRRAGRFRPGPPRTVSKTADAKASVLTEADLGRSLGARATLVQFSTAFCAPCRPTRQILTQVADMVDGVTHVEIDAAERLDLVRRLRISSSPTVLVLGPDGAIAKRAVGLPRKADVIAALGSVIPEPGPPPRAAKQTPPPQAAKQTPPPQAAKPTRPAK
jgi:thiol-disulfide isomerase/thioredoxin